MTLDAEEVSYRARALAQAHPLTLTAKRYIDRVVADQRTSQPLPEIGIWAGSAVLNGYCVRRVEEGEAGVVPEVPQGSGSDISLDRLEEEASRIAAKLRTGEAGGYVLGEEARTVETLDRIIGTEVEKRLDHWRDSVDEKAWEELAEYITWWAVKGYALRAAEVIAWQASAPEASAPEASAPGVGGASAPGVGGASAPGASAPGVGGASAPGVGGL